MTYFQDAFRQHSSCLLSSLLSHFIRAGHPHLAQHKCICARRIPDKQGNLCKPTDLQQANAPLLHRVYKEKNLIRYTESYRILNHRRYIANSFQTNKCEISLKK